jgi:hypothetical protein
VVFEFTIFSVPTALRFNEPASSRLERCFRDAHMVTHHMMIAPSTIEMVGQYLLGGPLQPRR